MTSDQQKAQQELRDRLNALPTVIKFRVQPVDPKRRLSDSAKTLFNTREEAEEAAKGFEVFGDAMEIKEEVRRAR